MDFPAIAAHNITPPAGLEDALGVRPQETLGSAEDLLVVLDTDFTVREVQPDFPALARIECRSIIITARGELATSYHASSLPDWEYWRTR